MDRKLAVTTSWVLVSGTLLLGGCMTPGYHNQEPPGFNATYQEFDRHWHSFDELGPRRDVLPVQFERNAQDLPTVSACPDVPLEADVSPLMCP